jgi:hypothetical protein
MIPSEDGNLFSQFYPKIQLCVPHTACLLHCAPQVQPDA